MKKRLINKTLSRWILLLLMLVTGTTQGVAQNVTIDLIHGSLLGAVTDEGETGFAGGFKSLWRHEQLALSMTGTDRDGLTESGEISEPSAVFGNRNGNLIITGGRRPSFIVVSLPKGYRITGYTLVLKNDMVRTNLGGDFSNLNSNQEAASSNGYGTMRFYETKPWPDNGTNAGHAARDGSDSKGYNANHVRNIELGLDYQNGQIGTTSSDVLATAAATDGDTDINTTDADRNKTYTISRTSDTMGNQLYFRLVKDYCFYGLTIESFEIQFTAEGTFEADVVPSSVGKATSVVRSPFKTNKIDIGEMKNNTQAGSGATAFSYNWEEITDLEAYNYLYQKDAVADGVPADVAPVKNISPVKVNDQLLYALGNDTYYIETPVEVVNHGNHAPIGYRIVGARFNYLYGDYTPGETHESVTHHYITYESGGTTYYLDANGRFIPNEASAADWIVENNGRIHSGNTYLGCSTGNGNNYNRTLVTSNIENYLNIDGNGNLYYDYRRWGNLSEPVRLYLHGTTSASTTPTITNNTEGLAVWTTKTVEGYETPAFDPGPYTLKIWKRDGTAVEKTITVNNSEDVGVYDLNYCNNDAIKFQIEGLAEGKQALVSVTLFLQALNPYIDKMDIVCHDAGNHLSLTQSFTADNFSVGGDKFIFYVPEDYGHEWLTFTFSNLYSKYGDDTYYDHSKNGYGRYSFVRSPYFIPVDGSTNDGLYASAYSPDAPYDNKVYTSVAGKYRFKFNNAEDLAKQASGTGGYFEEYPFSVATYLQTENPGDPTASPAVDPSTDLGTFIDCKLRADQENQKSGTYYVFTADETRWNIAPTKAWQHRYYAFYRMEIELVAKTFTPKFTWTPIYDKTYYDDGTGDKEDSMWGLTLDINEQGVDGYLTYQEIIDRIKGRGNPEDANYIAPLLDPTNTDAPASMKQILYIDGTPLYAMLNSSQGSEVKTLADLKNELNANSLVFLPENTTSTLTNVAYKTASGTYRAGKDIELTDKLPFYSPYDIQVDAANYAIYTRKLTKSTYATNVQYATVFMPFTISLTDGQHSDADYGIMEFMQMNTNSATSDKYFNYGPAAFFTATTADKVEANTPYALKIVKKGNSTNSFTLRQYGSNIIATPKKDVLFSDKEIISTGNLKDKYGTPNAYTFSHVGTFSGGKVDREEQKLFYFASNGFYSSAELKDIYTTVDIYPFRSVYQTSGGSAKIGFLMLAEGENPDMATGIKDVDKVFTGVTTGKGFISITTDADTAYRIRTVSGQNIDALNLKAGESRTVYVPAGIYLVNGLKVLVK